MGRLKVRNEQFVAMQNPNAVTANLGNISRLELFWELKGFREKTGVILKNRTRGEALIQNK